MCPRCKAPETFVRNLRCPEGLVQEDHCSCGWSKPRLLVLSQMEKAIKPATAKDWKPSGFHEPLLSGSAGGKANFKKNGLTGVARRSAGTGKKARRKPYARKNPRLAREAMGYQHLGALETFYAPGITQTGISRESSVIIDPSTA